MTAAVGPTLAAFVALALPLAWSVPVVETDACDVGAGGAACSMALLQREQGARRAAGVLAPERVAAAVAASGGSGVTAAELHRALKQGGRIRDEDPLDMNGKPCSGCVGPLPERVDRNYSVRTDCGNHTNDPEKITRPLITYSRKATDESPETNAWCELNLQKYCADAVYNKDFLYDAKAVDYPMTGFPYDLWYCHYNGWLKPEIVALQHDFEGMQKKSAEVCASDTYMKFGWNSTLSLIDFFAHYHPQHGKPTEEEALFLGAWTCAMGASGCDMTYCAYSFCEKGDGTLGRYDECEGWDPVKGMPIPEASK